MKNMRHVGHVMRPPPQYGQVGETAGQDATIIPDWRFSLKTLTGRELEIAQQMTAVATLEARGWGNPKRPVKETDYIQFGERKLNVVLVDDLQQNGVELRLLCSESK